MQIQSLDHFVITTGDLAACLHFYTQILGMRHEEKNGRHALFFGQSKINIHTRPAEFLPAAQKPVPGSLDLCFAVKGGIGGILEEIKAHGYPIAEGPVTRHGARGQMTSVYLYDPDGNLIELAGYEN